MKISKDSFATLLLCSDIGLVEEVKVFTSIQWYKLAEKLWANKLTPKDLFDIDSISTSVSFEEADVERIKRLLDRAGQFGVALSALNEKGIFTLTKSDENYPKRLKSKLKKYAPPILFYSGNLNILNNDGIAIVGSRNIDVEAMEFTEKLAAKCVDSGLNIISGGARGVDSIAENTSNNMDGTSLIFMADSLERKLRNKETRNAIMRNETLVLSAQRPDLPFKVYTAMDRNKYIYAMANYVVVVSSDADKGGTWTGAIEDLKNGWTPLFVRNDKEIPKGNIKLLEMDGVSPIHPASIHESDNILTWFDNNVRSSKNKSKKIEGKQLSFADILISNE